MSYIIPSDYTKSIQAAQLQQITRGDTAMMLQAERTAMERAQGMLMQKYDITAEFTDTALYSTTTIYQAAQRVYTTYAAYVSTNSYVIGNYCSTGGFSYVCTTNTTGAFNHAHWSQIGTSTAIYYAAYPYPYFDLYFQYKKDDYITYKGKIYKAKQSTGSISNIIAVQYGTEDNIPNTNVFPDDGNNGASFWLYISDYTVAANKLSAAAYNPVTSYAIGDYAQFDGSVYIAIAATTGQFDPTKWRTIWQLGDNRSQLMVTSIVDLALWYIHKQIAPSNIPDLRVDAYNVAIEWFRKLRDGIEQTTLPLIQPKQGRRILSDSRVARNNYY
jgi:hypothetical protein